MEKNSILSFEDHHDLRLREINTGDLEDLRQWKNENKQSFFLNHDITSEQQEKWYAGFSQREDDHMFIVEQLVDDDWEKIGCMGFRKIEEEGCIDGYNIIRAHKYERATFSMSEAFLGMLAYAEDLHTPLPIMVKVLSANPAVEWYEKNHFKILRKVKDYFLMELDKEAIKQIIWTKQATT